MIAKDPEPLIPHVGPFGTANPALDRLFANTLLPTTIPQ
jgi:hypothetical protein